MGRATFVFSSQHDIIEHNRCEKRLRWLAVTACALRQVLAPSSLTRGVCVCGVAVVVTLLEQSTNSRPSPITMPVSEWKMQVDGAHVLPNPAGTSSIIGL